MFKKYRVTSKYGWRIHPITKKSKFHAGIDLVKGHKTAIPAFIGGRVIYAGLGKSGTGVGGYGNVVVIKDSKGYAHVYAHLDKVRVRSGQQVNKGTVIGTQGATGNVTGSHLHFEVRKKSSPSLGWTRKPEKSTVDPVKYVKKYGGNQRMVEKLKVDGLLGYQTIKREQQFFGTVQDGKISKPSLLIRKRQDFLNKYGNANLKVDGYEGKKTIKAEQKFHGTVPDGKISKPSLLIKARQKFLNSYGR